MNGVLVFERPAKPLPNRFKHQAPRPSSTPPTYPDQSYSGLQMYLLADSVAR